MKNIISIILGITSLVLTFTAIGYTEAGKFSISGYFIIIIFFCCFCIYWIAKSNDEEEKKQEEMKLWLKKHENFCLAMEKARKD